MCESYKQLLIVYDIKIVVTFYQILIINPCVSDGNPITSWHVQVVIRVVKCVIQKKKKKGYQRHYTLNHKLILRHMSVKTC